MFSVYPFLLWWLGWYIYMYTLSYYHHQFESMNITHCLGLGMSFIFLWGIITFLCPQSRSWLGKLWLNGELDTLVSIIFFLLIKESPLFYWDIRRSRPTSIHILTPPPLTAQSLLYQSNPSIAFWQNCLLPNEPLAVHVLPFACSATFCQPATSSGKEINTSSFKLYRCAIRSNFLMASVNALIVLFAPRASLNNIWGNELCCHWQNVDRSFNFSKRKPDLLISQW